MILVLGIKVIILHTKLSILSNPCEVTCAFCFPPAVGSHSIHNHYTDVAPNLTCSQEYNHRWSLHAVYVQYLCAHWNSNGNFSMHLFCMCFAEYNLLICLLWELDVYSGFYTGFWAVCFLLYQNQNPQYSQTFNLMHTPQAMILWLNLEASKYAAARSH